MTSSDAFPSKWLRPPDLEGKPRLVTIESVELQVVKQGKPAEPVATYRELTKPQVVNKTNWNTIASFLGDDSDAWLGKKIVLYPTQTEFQGCLTDCIRVRQPKPPPQQAAAPPTPAPTVPARPSKAAEEMAPAEEDHDPF